jgi:hypothetical protein
MHEGMAVGRLCGVRYSHFKHEMAGATPRHTCSYNLPTSDRAKSRRHRKSKKQAELSSHKASKSTAKSPVTHQSLLAAE